MNRLVFYLYLIKILYHLGSYKNVDVYNNIICPEKKILTYRSENIKPRSGGIVDKNNQSFNNLDHFELQKTGKNQKLVRPLKEIEIKGEIVDNYYSNIMDWKGEKLVIGTSKGLSFLRPFDDNTEQNYIDLVENRNLFLQVKFL